MSDVNNLESRIDGAFSALKDKVKQQQQREIQFFQERQKRLAEYEKVQAKVVEIARPRLQALAKRAGDRVAVTPSVSDSRRSARFEFRSPRAHITLTFSVAPDREVAQVVVTADLNVVPVMWWFDAHTEFATKIAAPDLNALTAWLDDRIVAFVELYVQIHEDELIANAETVEDPVAKVKFPKFAAGATVEHDGQTFYFIDESTKAEFMKK